MPRWKMLLLLILGSLIAVVGGGCGVLTAQTPTLPPVQDPNAVALHCNDGDVVSSGGYQAENNVWGKGELSGWSQCIGVGSRSDGSLAGRWTWDWPESDGGVRAYPEVIFGYKPGYIPSNSELPRRIEDIGQLRITYDLTSRHTGAGNLSLDVWLTDTASPNSRGVPPITHEIMIWLESYGDMQPGGSPAGTAVIAGSVYDVFVGENFGRGWRYIAFRQTAPFAGRGEIELTAFLDYARTEDLITGGEYVSSVEFGNEIVYGSGETLLSAFLVSIGEGQPLPSPTHTPPNRDESTISPLATMTPGILIHGRVELQDGGGLPGVTICRAFASYSGSEIAETDADGEFTADFAYIPGDEMITAWPFLDGYSFQPESSFWRHYHGYESPVLYFVAVPDATSNASADGCRRPPSAN